MKQEDKRFLVECLSNELVERLMAAYDWDIQKAMDVLYNSETFAKLEDERSGLYYQGDVYVFSYLREEIEKAKVHC